MSLRSNLESEFRSHHDSRKRNSSVEEFENLTGAEFETYLAKVLREHGFEDVGGTPPTGDQGADLIARRDGHAIVMQAVGSGNSELLIPEILSRSAVAGTTCSKFR